MPMFNIPQYLVNAILASILLSVIVGSTSPFIIMRRMSFPVMVLLHSVLAGGALSVIVTSYFKIYSLELEYAITLLFVLSLTLFIAFLVKRGISVDIATSIVVSLTSSLSVIFIGLAATISYEGLARIWGYLLGEFYLLTIDDLMLLLLTVIITLAIAVLFGAKIVVMSFDEEGAEAHGLNITFYHYLLYIIASLVVVVAVRVVGVIVVHIVLLVPGIIALRYPSNLMLMILVASFISLISFLGGIAFSMIFNLQPSGFAGLILFLTYMVKFIKTRLKSK